MSNRESKKYCRHHNLSYTLE